MELGTVVHTQSGGGRGVQDLQFYIHSHTALILHLHSSIDVLIALPRSFVFSYQLRDLNWVVQVQ